MASSRAVLTVWLRYFGVFRKNLHYGLVTTFVEPLLYLGSFGFGLGGVIGAIDGAEGVSVSYRSFVLSGLVAQTVLFAGFFEGAYGGFVRMYYQKIFQAISVTPITLSEVLWGEILWGASRALLSSSVVLIIGFSVGDFDPLGSLLMVPIVFVAALLFSALGMLIAALAQTIESISYPQYLLVFPMFLFCGVYFPLANLPDWLTWVVWILPLTSVLSLARTLTLDFPFEPQALLLLIFWTCALVPWARRQMSQRLMA